MRLMIFAVIGLCLAVIAYAFSAGGTLAGIIFFFVLFNGVLDRWVQPMLQRLRP
jgi:mannose/fructose/N-acetylgalactosamine-specific phosphotransferase system component IID